ncbi:Ima1 N-terminal domain-containing protein [Lophiotrema nucula]|uniref:Ima1 N-terminal domain-containing protein n=1 Tax=Lophiotrema nucula TaxID=690887 RepID=A0A6A5ZDM2_9PLEO|nr:Ima1 N-terminal domain-containing protein [Lophiotrema nucula]
MPRLLKRYLRCHYCNQQVKNTQTGIPRTWDCLHCGATNWLDKRGQITDPPVHVSQPDVRFARPRVPSPGLDHEQEFQFCRDCQKNQTFVTQYMADYLPEENDPDYRVKLAAEPEVRAELEARYPTTCETCIGPAQEAVRRSTNRARGDRWRQILAQSEKNKDLLTRRRPGWRLQMVRAARWIYISGLVVGLLWHSAALLAIPDRTVVADPLLDWSACLTEAATLRQVDQTCFNAPTALWWVWLALWFDAVTLWWNPRIEPWMFSLRGKLRGLPLLWLVRLVVLGLRVAAYKYITEVPQSHDESHFYTIHSASIVGLILATLASYKAVYLVHKSDTFMEPLAPYLPQLPARLSPAGTPFKTAVPKATTFDTMAQAFTDSFNEPATPDRGRFDDTISTPTTTTTQTSRDSELDDGPGYISYYERMNPPTPPPAQEMDWTPTPRRAFAHVLPKYDPIPDRSASPPQPPPVKHEPYSHSIFSQKDPNPFRHRVPAAPVRVNPYYINPWKAGIWQPVKPDPSTQAVEEALAKGRAVDQAQIQELRERGVPTQVKKEAALFKKPQFKYDYQGYGAAPQSTGLEDKFGDMFR